jgi:hypothetical protein
MAMTMPSSFCRTSHCRYLVRSLPNNLRGCFDHLALFIQLTRYRKDWKPSLVQAEEAGAGEGLVCLDAEEAGAGGIYGSICAAINLEFQFC